MRINTENPDLLIVTMLTSERLPTASVWFDILGRLAICSALLISIGGYNRLEVDATASNSAWMAVSIIVLLVFGHIYMTWRAGGRAHRFDRAQQAYFVDEQRIVDFDRIKVVEYVLEKHYRRKGRVSYSYTLRLCCINPETQHIILTERNPNDLEQAAKVLAGFIDCKMHVVDKR